MKFSIDRQALLEPLQLVSGVVERRQTQPILSNLLMVVDADTLTMTGTDQEVELTVRVRGISVDEPGELTVPARKLLDICRSLSDESTLTLSEAERRIAVKSGRFSSHLATLPSVEFPSIETEDDGVSLAINSQRLLRLLKRTSFAMAQQDVRYFFNGLLVEVEGGEIRLVATNGQRLATSRDAPDEDCQPVRVIVPRKGVNELIRLLNDSGDAPASVRFSDNHLHVAIEEATLTTKLIDGTYPDYAQAIPTENDRTLLGNRQEIREALDRTAILSNEVYRNVYLKMGDQRVDIHANNPLQEEAEETVAVDYSGEDLEIGFNVSYLLDALGAMNGDQVKMAFSDAKGACVLTDPADADSLFVVSPMML